MCNVDQEMTSSGDEKTKIKDFEEALKKAGKSAGFEVLGGQEAHDLMTKILADHEEEQKKPGYYAKYGYKWNDPKLTKYYWTKEMGEISGFGSEYEETCRFMVTKGMEMLDKYTGEDKPSIKTLQGVYGYADPSNYVTNILHDYLCKAPEDYFGKQFGPSGAQMQACLSAIVWITRHSWDEYVIEMSKEERNDKK